MYPAARALCCECQQCRLVSPLSSPTQNTANTDNAPWDLVLQLAICRDEDHGLSIINSKCFQCSVCLFFVNLHCRKAEVGSRAWGSQGSSSDMSWTGYFLVSVLSVQWPPAAAGGHLTNEINYGIMTTGTTSTGQEAVSCLASTPQPRQQKGDLVYFL